MKRYVLGKRRSRLQTMLTITIHPVIWVSYVLVAAGMAAYITSSVYAGLYVVTAESSPSQSSSVANQSVQLQSSTGSMLSP